MHEVITNDCPMLVDALYDNFNTLMKVFGPKNRTFILEMAQVLTMFK